MAQLLTDLKQDRLKEVLDYDPETGVFTWKVNRRGTARAGTRAGTPDPVGYHQIMVDGRRYQAHRLAFLFMTGNFPISEVDHINRDNTDNSWKNLRQATRSQNVANTKINCKNKSGYRNVCWDSGIGRWRADGKVNNKSKYLGHFDSAKEAAEVAAIWRKETFGEFAAA